MQIQIGVEVFLEEKVQKVVEEEIGEKVGG